MDAASARAEARRSLAARGERPREKGFHDGMPARGDALLKAVDRRSQVVIAECFSFQEGLIVRTLLLIWVDRRRLVGNTTSSTPDCRLFGSFARQLDFHSRNNTSTHPLEYRAWESSLRQK